MISATLLQEKMLKIILTNFKKDMMLKRAKLHLRILYEIKKKNQKN
jgi:hypothetical protein